MGFINGLVSYLIVLLIFVAVGGVGIFLGITLRRSSNARAEKADNVNAVSEE